MSQHTQGPWTVQDNTADEYGQLIVESALNGAVAICYTMEGGETVAPQECLRNAGLIAAAPDMLAALEMVDRIWSHDQTANVSPDSPLGIVRAAIAKAGVQS